MKHYLLFIVLALGIAMPASAQTVVAPQAMQEGSSAHSSLATWYLSNATSTQSGNTFHITFSVQNAGDTPAEFRYSVALQLNDGSDVLRLADEYVAPDATVISKQDGVVTKSVTYTAPSTLSGKYRLIVLSRTHSGRAQNVVRLGTVTLKSTESLVVDPQSCVTSTVADAKKTYVITKERIELEKDDILTLSCVVHNTTSATVSLTPTFTTHLRSEYGAIVPTNVSSTTVTLAPNQKKTVTFTVPLASNPQAYLTELMFDGKSVASFRYLIKGVYAYFDSATLSSALEKKGDVAVLTARLAGQTSTSQQVQVSMTDASGLCGSPISQSLNIENGVTQIPITLTQDCRESKVTVALLNEAGETLDSMVVAQPAPATPSPESRALPLIPIVFGIALVLALAGIVWYRRMMQGKSIVPLALLFIAVSAAMTYQASASTVNLGLSLNTSSCGSYCPGNSGLFVIVTYDASKQPGQSMDVNLLIAGDDAVQPTCPVAKFKVDSIASYGTDVVPSCYSSQDIASQIFLGPISIGTVPSMPGNYAGTAYAAGTSAAGGYVRYNENSVSMPYTVVGSCSRHWVVPDTQKSYTSTGMCSAQNLYVGNCCDNQTGGTDVYCSRTNTLIRAYSDTDYITCEGAPPSVQVEFN